VSAGRHTWPLRQIENSISGARNHESRTVSVFVYCL
jgi:hypothetical protein